LRAGSYPALGKRIPTRPPFAREEYEGLLEWKKRIELRKTPAYYHEFSFTEFLLPNAATSVTYADPDDAHVSRTRNNFF
jgi:hypothetical protein